MSPSWGSWVDGRAREGLGADTTACYCFYSYMAPCKFFCYNEKGALILLIMERESMTAIWITGTRIPVLNVICYDIFKYTCNKGGNLLEFLRGSPGHRVLEGQTQHSSNICILSSCLAQENPEYMVLILPYLNSHIQKRRHQQK